MKIWEILNLKVILWGLLSVLMISGCFVHTQVMYDADYLVLTGPQERKLSKNKMTETVCEEFDGRGSLYSFILLKIMRKYPNIDSFDNVEIYSDGKCWYVEFDPCCK